MNDQDIINKYLLMKIRAKERVKKYSQTDKGKIRRNSYYYRKNDIFHPLYYPKGTKISRFERDGTPIINKYAINKSVKKYYYKILKKIYHPIYNPECENEGSKYKRSYFIEDI